MKRRNFFGIVGIGLSLPLLGKGSPAPVLKKGFYRIRSKKSIYQWQAVMDVAAQSNYRWMVVTSPSGDDGFFTSDQIVKKALKEIKEVEMELYNEKTN